jgi:endoglucanase
MNIINRFRSLTCILVLCSIVASSQVPFSRGVNLTGWFQADSPGQIQFTKFTKQDIVNIKSLGCDVIRLPVNLHSMTSGSPSYTLDPIYVSFLDSVITWCEDLKIYLIIDNHTFDPNANTSPDIGNILNKVWSQTAAHLHNRSDYVLYEILNEPHGLTTQAWGAIQGDAINAIRQQDTKHTIIVGGSGFNSYNEMAGLPVYSDDNLIYTFHFYDPFLFTHQGAEWVVPSMAPLAGVPFPYNSGTMPACPASLKGSWVESLVNNYPSDGTIAQVKQLINTAISFRDSRNVKIFCGEFGVYMKNSNKDDRSYWYQVVRDYLEQNNIPWTSWDYKGSFGLFTKGSNEMFNNDLNVSLLQALNFTVPPQTPFVIKPDSTGFMIYTDYTGVNINSSSSGMADFYSTDYPDNDSYCLHWHNIAQYNNITFDFAPDKDLSRLVNDGYAIDFMIRGSLPGTTFDLRFIDTKTTDPADHPWRMGRTISGNDAAWDRKWHHVHIPLTSLEEKGSWDNNLWYNPAGKFDWSAVDRLEISMESASSTGVHIWFDNIHITDRDTAIVREVGELGIEPVIDQSPFNLRIKPNPVDRLSEINYTLPAESRISITLYSLTGSIVATLASGTEIPGDHTIYWHGDDNSGRPLPRGIYICIIETDKKREFLKIIKN